jgi:16S rRNA (cytidine1402-2'-O)-methyltransferase
MDRKQNMDSMLYLVATPIGNLGDLSQRALDTLKTVDLIASEDTRKTGILLQHFGIKKQQISFQEHNEERAGERIIEALELGKRVALVTEAGMPGISDPGFTLARRAIAADIPFTVIPGANAALVALVLSGLPVHSFTFRGFAPRKPGARRNFLAVDLHSPHTLIFYESPYRVLALLQDCLAVYGDRPACVARELTKLHETVLRGTLSELIAQVGSEKPRGEYVVLVAGQAGKRSASDEAGDAGEADEVNEVDEMNVAYEPDEDAEQSAGFEDGNEDHNQTSHRQLGARDHLTEPGF